MAAGALALGQQLALGREQRDLGVGEPDIDDRDAAWTALPHAFFRLFCGTLRIRRMGVNRHAHLYDERPRRL